MNSAWERKRRRAIRTGMAQGGEIEKTRLALTEQEVKEFITKHDLLDQSAWLALEDLRQKVYFENVFNKKKNLHNELFRFDEEYKRDFPKLFWEEYVYQNDPWCGYGPTYEDVQEYAKRLRKVKRYLDRHPRLHGATGESMTAEKAVLKTLFGKTNYSWRGWGAIMAAYMNSKERQRKYTYMSFYM